MGLGIQFMATSIKGFIFLLKITCPVKTSKLEYEFGYLMFCHLLGLIRTALPKCLSYIIAYRFDSVFQ